jgi:hypothetical protein
VLVGVPPGRADAERVEEPRTQVVEQRLTGVLLDEGRERHRRRIVVSVPRADGLLGWDAQEAADEAASASLSGRFERVVPVPGGHREQVVDGQLGDGRVGVRRGMRRQQVDDPVVEPEPALGHGEADGGRREGLAQRVEQVEAIGGVGRPPALGGNVPVADDHEAVHLQAAGLEIV